VSVPSLYRGRPCYIVRTVTDAQQRQQRQCQQQQSSMRNKQLRHGKNGAAGGAAGGAAAASQASLASEEEAAALAALNDSSRCDYLFTHWREVEGGWRAVVVLPEKARQILGPGAARLIPISNRYSSQAAAARAADLAQFALLGVWKGMKLNFALGSYSEAERRMKTGAELNR